MCFFFCRPRTKFILRLEKKKKKIKTKELFCRFFDRVDAWRKSIIDYDRVVFVTLEVSRETTDEYLHSIRFSFFAIFFVVVRSVKYNRREF